MKTRTRVIVIAISVVIAGVVVIIIGWLSQDRTDNAVPARPRTPTEVVEAWHAALLAGDAGAVKNLSCDEVSVYIVGVIDHAREDREFRDHLNRHRITEEVIVDPDQASVTIVYELWRDGPDIRHDTTFRMQLINQNGWKFCGY